jgi:hypothetical protein
MFGRPIWDFATGGLGTVRKLAERKRRVIEAYRRPYLETSHAFLKSWSDVALGFFPQMKLVHLVRDPLAVAKSEAVREELIHRWRMPLRNYRGGDGRSYFRWSLTGLEPIFESFAERRLTRFQWYVVQWIEIENRAMQLLARYGKASDCFTLHSPHDLNSPQRVEALLEFLDLPRRTKQLSLHGSKNRTPGVQSQLTEQDERELAEVVALLPPEHLAVFRQPPYCDWEWVRRLVK